VQVGICVNRSLEMVIGLLGILKAGGAYVPLDPDFPPHRLAFMLQETQSPVLLTQRELRDRLPESAAKIVCIDADWPDLARQPTHHPPLKTTTANLAYVIFTSGSTGVPKGVMMPHGALTNLICWERDRSVAGPGKRSLQFASLSFDVSFQEVFTTLSAGGTLMLIHESLRSDPYALLEFLEQARIDQIYIPYAALNQLAEAARNQSLSFALQEIITAGEQLVLTPTVKEFIRQSGSRLVNEYGPTETHVVSSFCLTPEEVETSVTLPPIGRPINNNQLLVLDSHANPLPVHVAGELYVGGAGLARGYLNREDLTAEKFVPNPFSADPNARLYKTGDLCRWLPDGNLEFLGRIDQQVKIRGYRVEPGEIESMLSTHPYVREAIVIAREDQPGQKRLVGYVVPMSGEDDQALPVSELREHLSQSLPEYMVPLAFVRLDSLPLTPSGKIDRRALPAPEGYYELNQQYVQPRNIVEERLAAIWQEVLGLDRVGVLDNFFALGGHSLLATQVVSRIRDVFRIAFPLRSLFELPTIAELGRRIETLQWADANSTELGTGKHEETEETTF
jgi:surfactin family lipopeptide synthetase A